MIQRLIDLVYAATHADYPVGDRLLELADSFFWTGKLSTGQTGWAIKEIERLRFELSQWKQDFEQQVETSNDSEAIIEAQSLRIRELVSEASRMRHTLARLGIHA